MGEGGFAGHMRDGGGEANAEAAKDVEDAEIVRGSAAHVKEKSGTC